MKVNFWTKAELKKLHNLKNKKNKTFEEISVVLGRSTSSIQMKYRRTDWEAFLDDSDSYLSNTIRMWTQNEMLQLDAYLQSDKPYDFIAEKLNRSITSVERKAQQTDWKAWKEIIKNGDGEIDDESESDVLGEQLVHALMSVSRNEAKRLKTISEKEFLKRVNLDKSLLSVSFKELKATAFEELDRLGLGNPETMHLGEGTYVIVGDSHGKHTKSGMFDLLKQVDKHLKPKKIIHVGHVLDDDSDISYNWGQFKNLVLLTKVEELREVQDQRNKFNFTYGIVRNSIHIGNDLSVFNQDLISDYVKTPISSLDEEIFDDKFITNCHRIEFHTKCTHENPSYVASPGCLCERHVVRTIKQINFADGHVVKQANHDGFIKYRRAEHMNDYWKQGMVVVVVNKEGIHTIWPCVIMKTSKGYTTSFFDKIISEKGVHKPTKKIFINGDLHSDKHDTSVLDIQEQICKDYFPDAHVNLGDTHNYEALNHHVMGRGIPINKKILDEAASTYYALEKMYDWAKESYIICGNHERFAKDFIAKNPQFKGYIDFKFLCAVESSFNYKLTNQKGILRIGPTKFIHGDHIMMGAMGNKSDKVSRTFKGDVFMGHCHYPSIRSGCYTVGLSGQLDQSYNEPNASKWMHGFGMCNQYQGKSFPTTVAIVGNECVTQKKTYSPVDPDSWSVSDYDVKLVYDIK